MLLVELSIVPAVSLLAVNQRILRKTALCPHFYLCFSNSLFGVRLSTTMSTFSLPDLPSPHGDFIPYLAKNADKPIPDLLQPYKDFEGKLREGFAQHRDHELLQVRLVNAVPIYTGHEESLRIRARSLDDEVENQKYIFPLRNEDRKPAGAPAVVRSMEGFKQNFNIFSESSLVDLDWSNVVAAGSSVVTSLLPVPKKHNHSKRTLRWVVMDNCAMGGNDLDDRTNLYTESTTTRSWLPPATLISSSMDLTRLLRLRRSSRSRHAYVIPFWPRQPQVTDLVLPPSHLTAA